ncbi:GroES-like protein [Aureobasidium pullulans EXF-150]|uniref:GroES-like protein n=1 Tax=Aureobasidium pullulans EXF-150 TaxID=1043002 RepID=A0A074X5W0_AURPU|nr:GroES-like protein [Aureobasidium pullulans EXF-150]KEQ79114.1 GroES-like protein [Aureobasidium pullulans EXF-150]
MAQHPENQAAWLNASKSALEVGPAPYTHPGPDQLVIRNAAIGINPIDWLKQSLGEGILPHIRYPTIFGEDIAGTVVATGEGVTRFHVGDRVFALYTIAREWLTCPLPASISFEQGCALPLALIVAGLGLFGKEYLGLDLPTVLARPKDEIRPGAIIIAGGASAVGGTAVQLASQAGYEVISTSSLKNFDLVKSLAVHGRELVGAFSLGDGIADYLADVLNSHEGPVNKFIARAEGKHDVLEEGDVVVKFILISPQVIGPDTPLRPIFEDYLPKALDGQFVPRPTPEVVGKGLDQIQNAMDVLRKGVSAKKIVVQL